MKTRLLYIGCMLCALILYGCKEDFDPNGNLQPSLSPHYLNISATQFNNSAASFSETIKVESMDTPWKFSSIAEWISLTPLSGSSTASVAMNVEENLSAINARTSIFYLESTDPSFDFSRAISVSQAKAASILAVDTEMLTFSGTASQQSLKITANCEWDATCLADWVILEKDLSTSMLKVSVSNNPTDSERTSNISISNGDAKTIVVKVVQSPASISVSEGTLQYENIASKYVVVVDSEMDWTSSASESWIQISPDKGNSGKTEVSIEVAPNTAISERVGYVNIYTASNLRLQIMIVQKGIYIEADPTLVFSSISESKILKIKSNTNWEVLSSPKWLTVSQTSGSGNSDITVTSSDNPNTNQRSGEIEIDHTGLNLKTKVSVIQAGKSLSTDVTLLEFSDKAGEMNFNLFSDAAWTSSISSDWFRANPESGNGNAIINVAVQENTTIDERTGTIIYRYADKSTNVNIHQLAKYLNIDNRAFEFDSKGGVHTIELFTNDDWTVNMEESAPWLSLSQTSGSGNALITLSADDNASVSTRSTVIDINTKNSQSVRIFVTQKARYLTVSTESVTFFAKGGTSEMITVDSNGSFDINGDSSWFTVNKGEGNTFTVIATKNSQTSVRRGKITLSLTDLVEGSYSLEISVIQAGEGESFIIDGYTEDGDWNYFGNDSLSISIKGYNADNNWDKAFGGLMIVKIAGYDSDKDWNPGDKSDSNFSITDYNPDNDWTNITK